ncbi:hypothetical protein A2U01_0105607, partial [Trifolium medium]|nr:hypothetical protein [Trifolium medium]
ELSAQKMDIQELMKNQKSMSAKEEEMSDDLKAILSLLQTRNP